MESWLHDEDVLALEGRLEGGLELEVVDREPDQTAAAQQVATNERNLFSDLFKTCSKNVPN